jgi:chemotaxis regulatin CheY-phosphate phosphatase CheZ
MQNTAETPDEHRQPTSDLVKELTALTRRLVAGVCAAEPDRVGMATAGAVLAATDRLTAAVVEVLARVSHRGVIADEGLSAGA